MNENLFRLINDLGKQHTFFNPIFVLIAEYMVIFLALIEETCLMHQLSRFLVEGIKGIGNFYILQCALQGVIIRKFLRGEVNNMMN